MTERLSQLDFDRIVAAVKEKNRLTLIANVAIAEANLAEARVNVIHSQLVEAYNLHEGDSYENDGTIKRVK